MTWLLNVAASAVLTAFLALAIRMAVLGLLDRPRRAPVVAFRVLAAIGWLLLAVLYALFSVHVLRWTAGAVAAAGITALVVLGPLLRAGRRRRLRPTAALGHLCLALALLLAAAITLMGSGFLALTADRPVLLVDVTGETATRMVRWAPPDQPPRDEALRVHRVIFRQPDETPVAEAWVYGDEVAVKGRVLRLAPILNAAGVPNLFELTFAHNGYATAERHGTSPHMAVPLPASGPLAVHPWWRRIQTWLLDGWERHSAADRPWAIRSLSIESTYFPLVDGDGGPARHTYRLVLTPGGLSSS